MSTSDVHFGGQAPDPDLAGGLIFTAVTHPSLKLLLLTCAIFLRLTAGAQSLLQYTRLTASDGLSSNFIQCILQDRSGIFWIGTNNGLNRYDGSGFMQYSVLSKPTLTNGVITCLFQDPSGLIWIGTENGLNILDPTNNNIRRFIHSDNEPGSLPAGVIHTIQQLNDGTILLMSDRWLAKADASFRFTLLRVDPDLARSNMVMTGVTEKANNEIWISYLDSGTALTRRIIEKGKPDSISAPLFYTDDHPKIFVDPFQNNYSISSEGVNRYNRVNRLFEPWIKIENADISTNLHVHTCYAIDADGNIWQGAEKINLIKYDLKQRKAIDYKWLLTSSNASMTNVVYKDNSNNIWLGTDNGIIKISSRVSFFGYLPFSSNGRDLRNIRCRRILVDKDNILYAGTENYGLVKRPLNGTATQALSTFGGFDISQLPKPGNSMHIPLDGTYDIGYLYDFWYDSANFIWVAGYSIGRYDIQKGTLDIFFTEENEQLRRESITLFSLCHTDSLFWTGGQFNVFTFNPVTREMKPFIDNKGDQPFHGIPTWSIVNQGGYIWAGTYKGLYRINPHTHEVTKDTIHPVLNYGINDILVAKDGNFWISTAGGGVIHYNTTTHKSTQYSTEEGLSNNTVCGILEDNNNNLWISTYAGLSYLETKSGQFTNFFAKDGLTTDEFNRKAFFKLPDGRMIFGGLNGYVIFNPADAFKNEKPMSLILTRFSKTNGNGEVMENVFGVNDLKKVEIDPDDTFFSFGVALTDMYDPSGNNYTYQLKGLDNKWHSAGNDGVISFNSPPAGNYTLMIRGRINKGSMAQNEIVIPILVRQVYYKTAWFILLMILLAAGIIYMMVQYRIRQIKKMQLLRTRIASDLHDEVGGSLVRITMLTDAMKREGIKDKTEEQLGVISGISRGAISTMKDVIWSIDARNDSLTGLIDHIHEHTHQMLVPANIEFEFKDNGLHGNDKIDMDFRQNIYLIYKEAINNIVKHSGATLVKISISRQDGVFSFRIQDNGKGITNGNGKRSGGQGIANMKMRAAKMKANLEISTNNGTTILLIVPSK